MHVKNLPLKHKIIVSCFFVLSAILIVCIFAQFAHILRLKHDSLLLANQHEYLQAELIYTSSKIQEVSSREYITKWANEFRNLARKGQILFKIVAHR